MIIWKDTMLSVRVERLKQKCFVFKRRINTEMSQFRIRVKATAIRRGFELYECHIVYDSL